ncbi:MAG: DUF499 domain-containing protein [Proteobacteria bacterium]|nr:DUF499 domain-containing protein [Pseudomonadota bacterium]
MTDAYPFHPDLRELVGKFKENEGFQQTRGVIRLRQMVVYNLWKSERAATIDLIHPYDLDLNLDEIASEIRTINPSLSEAIAHDVAHGGNAEVEQIDIANGNTDASDAARLILVASLSTTPGAIHGLREYQLVDCLQRPGRRPVHVQDQCHRQAGDAGLVFAQLGRRPSVFQEPAKPGCQVALDRPFAARRDGRPHAARAPGGVFLCLAARLLPDSQSSAAAR